MKKTKSRKPKVLLISIFIIALIFLWLYWGNTSIQTTKINIASEKVPKEFDGYTIVQVSDLHNEEFGVHQTKLLELIKKASPDMIAVTGDLIDSNHTDVAAAMEFIRGAVKIAPVYYVTGNHEGWSEQYGELKRQMSECGVQMLMEEQVRIKRKESSLLFIGLNDPDCMAVSNSYESRTIIEEELRTMTAENHDFTILLSHRPELFPIYTENNIDLVLSGHAHGGQVRLPFAGGLIAPDQGFFPKYSEGVYEENQTKMVVSRGLANSIIPLRINNRPELVVITLTAVVLH